jgi:alkanesulfonate monooxygenase SsuD/methylene tetrahydromethanopterin reductase-like flavin-dependent oxidoreductase (luciferase family)
VNSSLLLGLELPALAAPADRERPGTTARWWALAEAGARAGWGALWVAGGPGAAPGVTCDPCTMAAAAVPVVAAPLLGVVSVVPVDRHPAVLARDVSALDVVSGGRAAVLLRWGGAHRPAHLLDAAEHLAEAAAICRAVFVEPRPVYEGRFLHVAGAVNRPPPLQAGGPPVAIEVPTGWAAAVSRDDVGWDAAARLASAASAVVTTGNDAEVAACRRVLDELAGGEPTDMERGTPSLLWRGALSLDRGRDVRRSAKRRHAGADGIVAALVDPVDEGSGNSSAGEAAHDVLAAVLSELAASWRR